MINTLMKTTDFEFIAAIARIYGEASGKWLDLPMYLVAVGANGSVIAERNERLEEQWTLADFCMSYWGFKKSRAAKPDFFLNCGEIVSTLAAHSNWKNNMGSVAR
jgi:hypothetical protein